MSFARFHPVLASCLGMAPHELTACGMSLGFADAGADLNCMEMPRRCVDEFVCMAGFDAPAHSPI